MGSMDDVNPIVIGPFIANHRGSFVTVYYQEITWDPGSED